MTKSHVSRLTSKKLTQEGRGDSRTAPADALKVDIGSPEGCRDSPVFQAKPLEGCSIALTRQHKEKDRPTDCLELRPGIPQSKETSSLIPQPEETSTNLEKEEKDLGTELISKSLTVEVLSVVENLPSQPESGEVKAEPTDGPKDVQVDTSTIRGNKKRRPSNLELERLVEHTRRFDDLYNTTLDTGQSGKRLRSQTQSPKRQIRSQTQSPTRQIHTITAKSHPAAASLSRSSSPPPIQQTRQSQRTSPRASQIRTHNTSTQVEQKHEQEQKEEKQDEHEEKEEEEKKEADDLKVFPALEKLYGPWLRVVDDRRGCFKDDLFSEVSPTDNNLLLIQAVCHRNRTYSRIPAAALPDFINIVRPALEVMVGALNRGNDELFTQALQSFLIIPQFALVKNPKETASEVRHKNYQFSQ